MRRARAGWDFMVRQRTKPPRIHVRPCKEPVSSSDDRRIHLIELLPGISIQGGHGLLSTVAAMIAPCSV